MRHKFVVVFLLLLGCALTIAIVAALVLSFPVIYPASQTNAFAQRFPQLAQRGFSDVRTVLPGGQITFYCSSLEQYVDAVIEEAKYTNDFTQWIRIESISRIQTSDPYRSECPAETGCNFTPSFTWKVPTDANSGFYRMRYFPPGTFIFFVVGCSPTSNGNALSIVDWLTGGHAYNAYHTKSAYGWWKGNSFNDGLPISLRFPAAIHRNYGKCGAFIGAFDNCKEDVAIPSDENPFHNQNGWGATFGPNYPLCYATSDWLAFHPEHLQLYQTAVLIGKHEYVLKLFIEHLHTWIQRGGHLFFNGYEFGWQVLDHVNQDTVIYPTNYGPTNFPAWSQYRENLHEEAQRQNQTLWPEWLGYENGGKLGTANMQRIQDPLQLLDDKSAWTVPNVNYLMVGSVEQIDGNWHITTLQPANSTIYAVSTNYDTYNKRHFYGRVYIGNGYADLFSGSPEPPVSVIEWLQREN